MALKLPDSAVPMGDFPVAKAVDIDFNDGENLQEKLDNGKLGGGGGSPENITRLMDFDEALPEKDKNKIYCVEKSIDGYKCGQWRVESMYYDVTGAKQYRGVQIATSINGVDNIMLMRAYYLDDDNVMRWGAWQKIATQKDLDDLFQSVSSGKTLVANAITDKGVSTATDATFATMATNISKITTNGYKEETVSYDKTSTGTNRIIVTFSADIYGVKQITPPSDASSNIVPETSTSMFTIKGRKLTLYVNGVGTWKVTAIVNNA